MTKPSKSSRSKSGSKREFSPARPLDDLHREKDIQHGFDSIMTEESMSSSPEMTHDAIAQYAAGMPEDSPIGRFYNDEVYIRVGGAEDSEQYSRNVTENRFRNHLFCEFFRMQDLKRARGRSPEDAINRTEEKLISLLESLFERDREEISETMYLREVAQAFREEWRTEAKRFEQPES